MGRKVHIEFHEVPGGIIAPVAVGSATQTQAEPVARWHQLYA